MFASNINEIRERISEEKKKHIRTIHNWENFNSSEHFYRILLFFLDTYTVQWWEDKPPRENSTNEPQHKNEPPPEKLLLYNCDMQ